MTTVEFFKELFDLMKYIDKGLVARTHLDIFLVNDSIVIQAVCHKRYFNMVITEKMMFEYNDRLLEECIDSFIKNANYHFRYGDDELCK